MLACRVILVFCSLLGAFSPGRAGGVQPPRVTRMDIDLTLDTERGVIREEVAITITGRDLGKLAFAIHESLQVERSRTSSGFVEHRKAGSRLDVFLDPPLNGTRTLTFTVTGHPGGRGGSMIGARAAVLDGADAWYPRLPVTHAEVRVRIRAPEGWTAVASGRAVGAAKSGTWEWVASRPVRSVSVAAAPGLELNEGAAVRTPVVLAAPGEGPDVDVVASHLADPMAWFSGALAPYPYDGFNLVLLPGFEGRVRGGGMMVVPAGSPLDSPSDGADLLAGQWYGELLAGDGAWIDSFAAWQSVVYCRDRARPLPAAIARLREGYFALPPGIDVPLSRADRDAPPEVIRGKGSAAPDMIRITMSNRDFFRAVTALFEAEPGPPVSLAWVRAVFEKSTGRSLGRAFADWFDRTGAPDLEAKLRTFPASRGGWRVDLTLVQRGRHYALPVEVVFHGPGQSHRETLEIGEERTSVVYTLPFKPARVEVDPGGKIFARPAAR